MLTQPTLTLQFIVVTARIAVVAVVIFIVTQGRLGYNGNSPRLELAPASQATSVLDLAAALTLFKTARTVFVDARPANAWKQGHIMGAISLPLAVIQAEKEWLDHPGLADAVNVVVYCDRKNCATGPLAAALLRRKLRSQVSVYGGGWEQWKALDLPYETD